MWGKTNSSSPGNRRILGSDEDADDFTSNAAYSQLQDTQTPATEHHRRPPPISSFPSSSSNSRAQFRNSVPSSPTASRPIYSRQNSNVAGTTTATNSQPTSPRFFPSSQQQAASISPSSSLTFLSGQLNARNQRSSSVDDDNDDPLEEKTENIPMTSFSNNSSSLSYLNPNNTHCSPSSPNPPIAGQSSSLPKSLSYTKHLNQEKFRDEQKSPLHASASNHAQTSSVSSSSTSINNSDEQSFNDPNATPPYRPTQLDLPEDDHLDLDDLEDDEARIGEVGPLLRDYQSHTSTIRKDYTTVDWYFTKHNLGRIRRMIRLTNKAKGWKGQAMNAFIAAQGWIILFFVGVATAASASFIHLVCEWLIDIKEGYCYAHSFFTTKRVCCMDASEISPCGWKNWDEIMLGPDAPGGYMFNFFIYILFAIPMALGASWFVHVYSKAAARSGLSEMKVMLGGFIIKKFLGIRTLIIKSLGVILGVSSGLHIGKLGPLVHIACCWGNIFARRFTKYNTNEVKKREILSASVAAGVSAAFGSPIGGVLFSLESVSSYFPPQTMWRSFWCSITAAAVLGYIDPFQTGKLVQFGVTSNANQWHWRELILFAMIGSVGGAVGASFNHLNIKVNLLRKRNKWLRLHPVKEVGILVVCTAIVSYPNIYLRGSSSALLAQLFTNCRDVNAVESFAYGDTAQAALCDRSGNVPLNIALLFIAGITKLTFTTLTYGCNVPSGIFMPGLVIGACIGRLVGWGLDLNFDAIGATGFFSQCVDKTYCISPGLYAIIGAAAVLTGITRLTVSLAIVIYEVTGGLEYIAPIMITIVCAKWSADAFNRQGLYPQRISKLHGYPWIDAYAEMELIGPAMEVMTKQLVSLTVYGLNLHQLKHLLSKYPYHGFPIIDNQHDSYIYGFIARSDLELLIEQNTNEEVQRNPFIPVHFSHDPPPYPTPNFLDFSSSVDKYPVKVLPHTPIDRVLGLFQGLGLRYVLVNSHKGQLLGIIKKKDMLLYIREQRGDSNSTV